jgi:hypothetical protein
MSVHEIDSAYYMIHAHWYFQIDCMFLEWCNVIYALVEIWPVCTTKTGPELDSHYKYPFSLEMTMICIAWQAFSVYLIAITNWQVFARKTVN